VRSFTWLNQGFSLNGPRPTLLFSAVQTYLLLVPATWLFARAVFAYASARRTGTLSAAVRTVAHDVNNWVRGAVRNAVNGLNEQGTQDVGSIVARAVALPWLIPAGCTLAFLIINKVFSLLPLALVLLVLVAYVVARLTWRLAERLHITSYRVGGATTGILCAILATMVCSIASIQSWVFLLQAGGSPSYGLLVSYLPPYLAMIMSLGRGLRAGWRSAAVTPRPSTASRPA
jgi:hypothetical protein